LPNDADFLSAATPSDGNTLQAQQTALSTDLASNEASSSHSLQENNDDEFIASNEDTETQTLHCSECHKSFSKPHQLK
jgi:hypothetical protein